MAWEVLIKLVSYIILPKLEMLHALLEGRRRTDYAVRVSSQEEWSTLLDGYIERL